MKSVAGFMLLASFGLLVFCLTVIVPAIAGWTSALLLLSLAIGWLGTILARWLGTILAMADKSR